MALTSDGVSGFSDDSDKVRIQVFVLDTAIQSTPPNSTHMLCNERVGVVWVWSTRHTIDRLGYDTDYSLSVVGEGEMPEVGGVKGHDPCRGSPLTVDVVAINSAFLFVGYKEKQLFFQLREVRGHFRRRGETHDLGGYHMIPWGRDQRGGANTPPFC